MKKFLSFLAIMLMAMTSVMMISCNDDDDSTNGGGGTVDTTVKYVASTMGGAVPTTSLASAVQRYFTKKVGSYGTVSCILEGSLLKFSIEAPVSNKSKVEEILKGIDQTEMNTEFRKTVTDVMNFHFTVVNSSTGQTIATYIYSAQETEDYYGSWKCTYDGHEYVITLTDEDTALKTEGLTLGYITVDGTKYEGNFSASQGVFISTEKEDSHPIYSVAHMMVSSDKKSLTAKISYKGALLTSETLTFDKQ